MMSPFSFKPTSVTLTTVVVYLAIFIPLLVIHETVPPAPTNPTVYRGLNLSEAWLDLDELSNGYHPFNSRRNDEIRDWLLLRIGDILQSNGVSVQTKTAQAHAWDSAELSELTSVPAVSGDASATSADIKTRDDVRAQVSASAAVVFSDLLSNYTSTALTSIGITGRRAGISTYFEGSNIIVYIRGIEDEEGDWWAPVPPYKSRIFGKGGIMVNAHFDSVSTGYGATDDGMGVVSALQLIRYFTTAGNTPKRGVVVLLNNGEEDGLYGAKAFLSHPIAAFVHAFLNLEGAGAGGRATLFRSTDTEVTRAYGKAKHPFGTVVSADGFALGVVRSQTDYVVFQEEGYRGLDVAFWQPRSKYHTEQDDTKHASRASLWHMLSASVETMKYLTADTKEFVGDRGDGNSSKVKNGSGSTGVWFDLFGSALAVFNLRSLFAWSLALLITSPIVLLIVSYLLVASDKYYLFAGSVQPAGQNSDAAISLNGWRGTFRFPIVFVVSSAITIGAAFLLRKVNPLIVYSSQYSVWAMSGSLFFCVFWFLMAGCNFVRPSALHRVYTLTWLFILGWALLVATTVYEDRYRLSGGYVFVIYESAIFLATLISLCELFALPTKKTVIEDFHAEYENRDAFSVVASSEAVVPTHDGYDGDDADPTETTPLVGGNGHRTALGSTFSRGYRRSIGDMGEMTDGAHDDRHGAHHAFGEEQRWSAKLPTWTWVLQFLILCPFILVVVGQVGLLLVSALAQTGADGNPLLVPYLVVALFSILLILPLTPFMHRITHHVPTFLFLAFIGTLIYNLVAFPFSPNNRYKTYFQQTVDLDSGIHTVTLAGVEQYVRQIISNIPSASGQTITCEERPQIRAGVQFCSYTGLAPNVIPSTTPGIPPEKSFKNWLNYTVTRTPDTNKATFTISGANTKSCILRFTDPFSQFHVHSSASNDGRWKDVPDSGSDQIKLWHRDWDREWVIDVEWGVSDGKKVGEEGRSGRVVCGWADWNVRGVIPALDEVERYMPAWAVVTKLTDGLVEGSKGFVI